MIKYVSISIIAFKHLYVYKLDILLRLITAFLTVFALKELWTVIYHSGDNVADSSGVSLVSMTTYAMASHILRAILAQDLSIEVEHRVRNGDIVFDIMKPWNYMIMQLSRVIGQSLYSTLFIVIPLLLTCSLMFPFESPDDPLQLMTVLISVTLAFFINFMINFLISLLAFLFTSVWGFEFVKWVLIEVFSGLWIPIWFFPEAASRILFMLPFQAIYHTPLSIFIGRFSELEALKHIGVQAIWLVLLAILSQSAYVFLRRQLQIAGG